jgi:hypothetical protein
LDLEAQLAAEYCCARRGSFFCAAKCRAVQLRCAFMQHSLLPAVSDASLCPASSIKRGPWQRRSVALLLVLIAMLGSISRAQNTPKNDSASDAERFWLQTEYLLHWTSGNPLPPLITSSPAGTPRSSAGVLPGAQVLFGGNDVDGGARHGARLALGYWLHDDKRYAVEAGIDWLGDRGTHFAADSSGTPILARPFIDATTGAQNAQLTAFPGSFTGQISALTFTQQFSANLGLRKNWLPLLPIPRDARRPKQLHVPPRWPRPCGYDRRRVRRFQSEE